MEKFCGTLLLICHWRPGAHGMVFVIPRYLYIYIHLAQSKCFIKFSKDFRRNLWKELKIWETWQNKSKIGSQHHLQKISIYRIRSKKCDRFLRKLDCIVRKNLWNQATSGLFPRVINNTILKKNNNNSCLTIHKNSLCSTRNAVGFDHQSNILFY